MKLKGWTRDTIKYIAAATMLLNHMARLMLPGNSFGKSIGIGVGYFAAITMCYFLVEGFRYTHSRKNYAIRMLVFACIAQLPYQYAFTRVVGKFPGFNMLFSLLLCLGLLHVMSQPGEAMGKQLKMMGLFFLSFFCDWPILAPFFVWLFFTNGNKRLDHSYQMAALAFGCVNFISGLETMPLRENMVETLMGIMAIAASWLCISKCYNGKKSKKAVKFHKWFFYVFYPAHIMMLCLLCLMPMKANAADLGNEGDYSEFLAEILAEINDSYTVKDIIFFGDSRVVGMSCVGGEGYHYVGKVSAGYSWMTGGGYQDMASLMNEYPEAAVVFCFGVNDMGNIESYISWYQNFMQQNPDRIVKLLSVNPIEDAKADAFGYYATNDGVAAFNERLEEAFPEEYLDCYDYLIYTGLASADGVHYSYETYWKIQEYVKEQIG